METGSLMLGDDRDDTNIVQALAAYPVKLQQRLLMVVAQCPLADAVGWDSSPMPIR